MYNQISFVTSDVYIQSYTQAFSIIESTNKTLIPNLSCSISGSTSIAYSLSSYNGAIFPLFVSIDYATGVLSIAAPSVSNSTDYSFYIISNITGVTSPVQNFIKLTVKKCTPSNWQLCSATDSSICTNCNTGYSLNSGSCSLKESETAKSLSSSGQAAVGASVGLWFVSSLLNAASLASLWSMINQTQIFLDLILILDFELYFQQHIQVNIWIKIFYCTVKPLVQSPPLNDKNFVEFMRGDWIRGTNFSYNFY